jgi:hypothetical protein
MEIIYATIEMMLIYAPMSKLQPPLDVLHISIPQNNPIFEHSQRNAVIIVYVTTSTRYGSFVNIFTQQEINANDPNITPTMASIFDVVKLISLRLIKYCA